MVTEIRPLAINIRKIGFQDDRILLCQDLFQLLSSFVVVVIFHVWCQL